MVYMYVTQQQPQIIIIITNCCVSCGRDRQLINPMYDIARTSFQHKENHQGRDSQRFLSKNSYSSTT